MNKLRRDLRIAMAGASCGLFSVGVFLMAERVNSYYIYLDWLETTRYQETYYGEVDKLTWLPVTVWHVVLSIVASLLMHRHLDSNRVSPFLRWQAIGVVALLGWMLTAFLFLSIECLSQGNLRSIEYTLSLVRYGSVARFIAMVFASNVLFGSAVQAASQSLREDTQAE